MLETGIGLRIRRGTEDVFVCGSELSVLSAYKLLKRCLEIAGLDLPGSSAFIPEVNLGPLVDFAHLHSKNSFEKSLPLTKEVAETLSRIDAKLWKNVKAIESSGVSAFIDHQDMLVLSTDGVFARDIRLNQQVMASAYASENGDRCDVKESLGGTSQPDFLRGIHDDSLVERLAKRSADMLHASFVESGEYPVVLGNGFGGVIFHEACGHLLETTAVRKKSSPFTERKGEKIAHSAVTAWDEGLTEGAYGSLSMDDEGMPAQRTLLIENGVLKNFLADRNGSLETNHPRTGSGRRQDYRYAPTSRMRNTYIGQGEHSPEDLIHSVDKGIYARKLGGGSVEPTGDFNFAITDAWLIEKGKLTKPLKGATAIGKGQEVLERISMCANDLELVPGACGSISGTIWTTVGQPHIKVDRLTIGGR
jgi:TldD protein